MSIGIVGDSALVAATTGSQNILLPGGVVEGNFLVMVLASRNSGVVNFAYPGGQGWTERAKIKNSIAAGAGTLAVATKVAGAAEGHAAMGIDFAGSGWGGAMSAFSGVDATTPLDVTTVVGDSDTALQWEPPNLSTVTPGAWVLSVVMSNDENGLDLAIAQSFLAHMSGALWTTVIGSDFSIGLASRQIDTPGLVVMPRWEQLTIGPDHWNGITLALRPADAAPPVSQLSKLIDMDNRRFVRVVT